ncbi:MAG: DinB family protein, partial [Gemmatimonadota bacterium]
LRATTLPLLTAASADDWTRTGVHPDYGSITLRNLLELYADHTERHVEQIAERRELLGSPIGIEPLLPERLY